MPSIIVLSKVSRSDWIAFAVLVLCHEKRVARGEIVRESPFGFVQISDKAFDHMRDEIKNWVFDDGTIGLSLYEFLAAFVPDNQTIVLQRPLRDPDTWMNAGA